MIRQTAERLKPLLSPDHMWVVTNKEQISAVRSELTELPRGHVLAEPIGRNTAAAIGLVAIHIAREYGDTVMAILPADHHIGNPAKYRSTVKAALALASEPGHLVLLGIPPSRPETGFGYVEHGELAARPNGLPAYEVRRFAEKPVLRVAKRYVASGRYLWNSGTFFWRVSTFLECLRQFLPASYTALTELSSAIGTRRYKSKLHEVYPLLENISVDYAIMEPATSTTLKNGVGRPKVFVIPSDFGWSDIGSWEAVRELLAHSPQDNISTAEHYALDAEGNFFWSANKLVAAIGVNHLILVDTPDAILICPRERAQDVGKVVKWLEERQIRHLL
jgi:mannose-1-phosphate guanylyltransferase